MTINGKSNVIDIEGRLKHQTPQAYLFNSDDDGEDYWIPKTQADYADGVLTLPEWLAIDKGMV